MRVVLRLVRHEAVLLTDVVRWVGRRGPRDVGPGDLPVPYAGAQAALMYGLAFAAVVETFVLALIVPWPIVHAIVLVLDLWGIYFVLALQFSCTVRPHVVAADGSLRLRHGAFLEVLVPASAVASARVERRYSGAARGRVDADGVAELPTGSETTVTVELHAPVTFVRPLGRRAQARTLRFYAPDPSAVVTALRAGQTTPTP
ncbi:hypothetical protein [Cryptosporangium arvum]|uniref:hypothetical protein n=1 Tax=Cryptosporangium arvum TaxID=80871 RepID=UPI000687AEF1|nr:hypothetical protein [Cryptosporangium arvum]